MFGYIKPYVPELRVREHELYRAMYCGLCRSMGSVTGQLSRFTLSYDFVFLAAVRLLLDGEGVPSGGTLQTEPIRCPAHPLSRRPAVTDNATFRYTAAAAASLFSAKLEDDVSDEKGAKRLLSRLIRPAARHMVKKSGVAAYMENEEDLMEENTPSMKDCRFPEISAASEACRHITPLLTRLASLEAEGCTSVDECASVFGELTAHLFSSGLPSPASRIAHEIGHGVGRFIYAADACDDAPEDLRLGRYNPILAAYGSKAVSGARLADDVAEEIRTAALLDLERTAAAVELACDSGGDRAVAAIVRNIIYLGMPHTIENIIGNDSKSGKASGFLEEKIIGKGRCHG